MVAAKSHPAHEIARSLRAKAGIGLDRPPIRHAHEQRQRICLHEAPTLIGHFVHKPLNSPRHVRGTRGFNPQMAARRAKAAEQRARQRATQLTPRVRATALERLGAFLKGLAQNGLAPRIRSGLASRIRSGLASRIRSGLASRIRSGLAPRIRRGLARVKLTARKVNTLFEKLM